MINKFRVGLYPGTFDPITRGHFEIICRATRIVDKLVIGVAKNDGKGPLFDTETRVKLVEAEIKPLLESGAHIEVIAFDNLLIDCAKDVGADLIFRGLRAVSDFEYEFQMAGMNRQLDPEIETIFLMATDKQQFVSSRFVKEIACLGGDIGSFVSAKVVKALDEKLGTCAVRDKIAPEIRD